ncbi:hypothetical protein WMY93_026296 [Mugilogobius chulae]|uniref:Uncharacterized protein n=1 Tax=Mugilogobius chulae TaxID=88201 RepID=A0AAW0N2T0_9GOBI
MSSGGYGRRDVRNGQEGLDLFTKKEKEWSTVAAFLIWLFVFKDNQDPTLSSKRMGSVQVFSGHMKLTNYPYDQKLEDTSSEEFKALARDLESQLKDYYQKDELLQEFYTTSTVTAFSEGVIAYYWSQFDIPPDDLDVVPEFSEERILEVLEGSIQETRSAQPTDIKIREITASFTDPRMARNPSAKECFFTLEAAETEESFTSPGFPNAYPAKSRCQWQIRASEENVIAVDFPFFHIEDDCSDDFVAIYDSLSPDDSQAITEKCGQRPPTNPLQVVSSGNIMLINLITDGEVQQPGFKAVYKALPKASVQRCGGVISNTNGVITSPQHPSFYPPAVDCKWTIQVPSGQKVRLKFTMFRMKEPNVDTRLCHKDYVEAEGHKYCGELSTLSLTSDSNLLTIQFHSDESYTDKGLVPNTAHMIPQTLVLMSLPAPRVYAFPKH